MGRPKASQEKMRILMTLGVLGVTLGAKRRALARAEEAENSVETIASLRLEVEAAEAKLEARRREVKAAAAAKKEAVRRIQLERIAAVKAAAEQRAKAAAAAAEHLHWLAAAAAGEEGLAEP